MALTERQKEILAFIQQFMSENNFPPTRMEIAKAMGFRSPNASEDHLRALERKGAIELLSGSSRGIRVIQGTRSKGMPLIGDIQNTDDLLARENIESRLKLDSKLFEPRADFLLRMQGRTMQEEGVEDGDLLAVQKSTTASNANMVVVNYKGKISVKRLRLRGNAAKLHSGKKASKPIAVDLRDDNFAILGVVVGVIRNKKV